MFVAALAVPLVTESRSGQLDLVSRYWFQGFVDIKVEPHMPVGLVARGIDEDAAERGWAKRAVDEDVAERGWAKRAIDEDAAEKGWAKSK